MEEPTNHRPFTILEPPVVPKTAPFLDWLSLPETDPLTQYLEENFWDQGTPPVEWTAARLSPAAFIYREKSTGWKILVKFYGAKTGDAAAAYAEREHRLTQQAWETLENDGPIRSVQPLGRWEGLLFLEFVEGLTLEDKIAIRRSQPGELLHSIDKTGMLLSRLHCTSVQNQNSPDFGPAVSYARKVTGNLSKYGVLKDHPSVHDGLLRLFDRWASDPTMEDFPWVLNHGDATTTNFVVPPEGGMVAIDWERSALNDPAADLGRLMAEISHSINQHGGNFEEGLSYAHHLVEAYCTALTSDWNPDYLLHRARFYQASSILRIARNGWLSRFDRLTLVLQAFALLID